MSFNKTEAVRNAEKFVASGKIKQAVNEYQQIVKRDPEDFTNLNILGDLLVKCGETKDALQNFCKVAEHYAQRGFPQKAIAVYNKIFRLKPDCVETLAKLADLNREKGALAEARVQYTKLSEFYEKNDDREKLADSLRALASLDKQGSKHLLKLGEVYRKDSKKSEAADAFAEAGERFLAKEDTDSALDAFSKALEQDSEHVRGFQGYVRISLLRGTSSNAVEKLEDILNDQPENSGLRELLSECYVKMGDISKAEEILMGLVGQEPQRYGILLPMLESHIAESDVKSAMRILAMIADRLLSDADPADVLKWTNAILEVEPQNLDAMRLQARFYTSTGDILSATTILERISVLASKSVVASAPTFGEYAPLEGSVNGVEPYGLTGPDGGDLGSGGEPRYESQAETGIAQFDYEEEVEPAREFVPSDRSAEEASLGDAPSPESLQLGDAAGAAPEYRIEEVAEEGESAEYEVPEDNSKDMGLSVSSDADETPSADHPAVTDETAESWQPQEPGYGFEILAITETKLTQSPKRASASDVGGETAFSDAERGFESEASSDWESDSAEESVEVDAPDDAFDFSKDIPTLEEFSAMEFEEEEPIAAADEASSDQEDVPYLVEASAPQTYFTDPEADEYSSQFESDSEEGFESESGAETFEFNVERSTEMVLDSHQESENGDVPEIGREQMFLSAADELAGLGAGEESLWMEPASEEPVGADVWETPSVQGVEDTVEFDESESASYPVREIDSEVYEFGGFEGRYEPVTEAGFGTEPETVPTEPVEYGFVESGTVSDEPESSSETPVFAASDTVDAASDEELRQNPWFGTQTDTAAEAPVGSYDQYALAEAGTPEFGSGVPCVSETVSPVPDDEVEGRADAPAVETGMLSESQYGTPADEVSAPQELSDLNSERVHYVAFEYSDDYPAVAARNGSEPPDAAPEQEVEPTDAGAADAHIVFAGDEGTVADFMEAEAPVGADSITTDSFEARLDEIVAGMNFQIECEPLEEAEGADDAEDASGSVRSAEFGAVFEESAAEPPAERFEEPVSYPVSDEVPETPSLVRMPVVLVPADRIDALDLNKFILRTDYLGRVFLTEFDEEAFAVPDFLVESGEEAGEWFDLTDVELDEAVYPRFAPLQEAQPAGFTILETGEEPVAADIGPTPVAGPAAETAPPAPTPLTKVLEDREKKLKHLLEGVDFFIGEGFFEVAQQSFQSILDEYGDRPEFAPFRERIELFISHSEPEEPIKAYSPMHNASLLSNEPGPYDPDFRELDALGGPSGDQAAGSRMVMEIDGNVVFDYDTCFDTATAYREMGLLDYAVREFENALKLVSADDGTRRFFQCCTMLGHCFMEYGKPDLAVTWFRRAQETPGLTGDEDLALLYEIANALEAHGKTVEAAKLFGHINSASVEYRDSSQRFDRLRNGI